MPQAPNFRHFNNGKRVDGQIRRPSEFLYFCISLFAERQERKQQRSAYARRGWLEGQEGEGKNSADNNDAGNSGTGGTLGVG